MEVETTLEARVEETEKVVNIGGEDVIVQKQSDGSYTAEKHEASFEKYLDEEVFSMGTYVYGKTEYGRDGLLVSEHEDGSGYVIDDDLERAFKNDNVDVGGIRDGKLIVRDDR